MYEVCMSADSRANSRIEPSFDTPQTEAVPSHHIETMAPPPSLDALIFDDDTNSNTTALMIKSGMAMLVAASLYGGYMFLSNASTPNQTAQIEEQQPLQAEAQKNIRKIDMTQTGSVKPAKKDTDSRLIVKAIKNHGATPPPDGPIYTVKSGDTLSRIGKLYKTSAKSIMELNDITDARSIKPGMKLVVSTKSQ